LAYGIKFDKRKLKEDTLAKPQSKHGKKRGTGKAGTGSAGVTLYEHAIALMLACVIVPDAAHLASAKYLPGRISGILRFFLLARNRAGHSQTQSYPRCRC
jgi:hypothetical protein